MGIVAALLYFLSSPLKKREMLRAAVILVSLWAYGWLTWIFTSGTEGPLDVFHTYVIGTWRRAVFPGKEPWEMAGLADLVFFPNDLFSADFQMSYAATLAIILLYGKISKLCATLPALGGYDCKTHSGEPCGTNGPASVRTVLISTI